LPRTLTDLAALIRSFDYTTPKGKNDTRWIEIDKNHNWMVSSVMYGPAIRILASAKLVRPVIESAAGGESLARIFYETIITALMGQDMRGQRLMKGAIESTIQSKSEKVDKNDSDFMYNLFRQIVSFDKVKNRVEPIAKTLEKWHSNDLLMRPSEQPTKASNKKDTSEILIGIQKRIDFFRGQWNKFCQMVERDGEQIEKCLNDPSLRVDSKREEKLEAKHQKIAANVAILCRHFNEASQKGDHTTAKRLEKLLNKKNQEAAQIESQLESPPKPGYARYSNFDYQYLNLPLAEFSCWIQPDATLLSSWKFYFGNPRTDLTDTERLIYGCALLSIFHDETTEFSEPKVYRHDDYKGHYFRRGAFAADLAQILKDANAIEKIQRTWERVKTHLPKEPAEPQPKAGSGSGGSLPTIIQTQEQQIAARIIKDLKNWASVGASDCELVEHPPDEPNPIPLCRYCERLPEEYRPNHCLEYRFSIHNKLGIDPILLKLKQQSKGDLAKEIEQRRDELNDEVNVYNENLDPTSPMHLPNFGLSCRAGRLVKALECALPCLGAQPAKGTEASGGEKVNIPELWKQVATEVEDLISQNSYAVERFKEQIRVCNRDWQPYWQSLCDKPLPYDDPTGKKAKPGYEYEPHLQCWYPKDVKRPPDPTVGECGDKLPYYYTILAVIYDSVKGKVAPFLLCHGILDYAAFKWTQRADKTRDRDMLYTAIKWVKSDLAKGTGPNAAPQDSTSKLSPRSAALILLKEHPDWTDTRITKKAGVSRTSVYRWPEYKKLRELQRDQRSLPHGSKNKNTGKIEAIAED